MKLKTGISVLSLNVLLVLLIGQEVRGTNAVESPIPEPLVQASVTVPAPQEPVVVEGALSTNTRGWSHASAAKTGAAPDAVRAELLDAYWMAISAAPAQCHLSVSLLSAIGQVESGNLAGRELDAGHRVIPEVLGPVLDGKQHKAIADTDDGRLDGDTVWDRAVGPMQFLPASWRVAGVDMDGDGRRDPQDIFDAAGTAMVYLCAGGRDLATSQGLREAVLSYNHSTEYLQQVLVQKAIFDRNPLTGWGTLPFLEAWEAPPLTSANWQPPPGVTGTRTPSPTVNVRPGAPTRPSVVPAKPVTPAPTRPPTSTVTPTPSTPATPTPTNPDPSPTDPTGTPDPTPTPTPDPTPTPTPDPTPTPTPDPTPGPSEPPTCPVPTAEDPWVAPPGEPTPEPDPEDGTIDHDNDPATPRCIPPEDPETGKPMTWPPQSATPGAPDAGKTDE